jgi:hypothetical protein
MRSGDKKNHRTGEFRTGESGSHQISHSLVSVLRFVGRTAIQHIGQAYQRLGCTRWTLLSAISDAVAILTEISPRQWHVLHREEFHRFAPHICVFHPFTPINHPFTPINCSVTQQIFFICNFTPMTEL